MTEIKGVYKRKDGRWEARYLKGISETGKSTWGSVYGKTKTEAIQKRFDIIGDEVEKQKVPSELNLLILGAGTHGNDVKEIAEGLRVFKKISFLDDNAVGDSILGKCKDAIKYRNQYSCAFVAIGDNKVRKKYAKFLKECNFLMPNIISPMALVSPSATLGEGIVIMPQSTVGAAKIGDFTIIASKALVNSEAIIGAYSHLDCGGIVLKGKKIVEGTWIKSGEVYGKKE